MKTVPLYKQLKPFTYPIEYYINEYLNTYDIETYILEIVKDSLTKNKNLRYELAAKLNISYYKTKSITDKIFPISKTNTSFRIRILSSFKVKQCSKCNLVLHYDCFDANSSRTDNKQTVCKFCKSQWIKDNKDYYAALASNRRNQIIAIHYKQEIQSIYRQCPVGYEVDHIVPLNNELVCGLHVPWNLQYLTVAENRTKSNKFIAR